MIQNSCVIGWRTICVCSLSLSLEISRICLFCSVGVCWATNVAMCHFRRVRPRRGFVHAPREGMRQGEEQGRKEGMRHPWHIAAPWYEHVVEVVICWFGRNIGCFTQDIHDFMACSCSAAIEQSCNVVTRRRYKNTPVL